MGIGGGRSGTDKHKVAGLTEVEGVNQSMSRNDDSEVDGGNQSVSSNDKLVIAHTKHTISTPTIQSGLHLDTSSSKSIGKGTVKGVYLGKGNKNKERVIKKTGGCISEE